MPRKKPTRKDNRYEYKLTLGRDIHGKPLRKSFYSTVSLSDAKKKAEEFRVASEVSARTGEAFTPAIGRFAPRRPGGIFPGRPLSGASPASPHTRQKSRHDPPPR